MPNFASAITEPLNDRKLTKEELIRAVRFLVSAEYEAVQMYQQVVEATDDELSIKVINSVIDEEKVHAGEFLKLLYNLDPEEAKHYKEGEKEVSKEIKLTEDISIDESTKRLLRLIDEKTVTVDDFNQFIAETSPTSINKRIQRQLHHKVGIQTKNYGRKIDDITDHKPSGNNDPTTTSRGRRALDKQIKRNKKYSYKFNEAIEFFNKYNNIPLSECNINNIVDKASLQKLTKALLQRESNFSHKWLSELNSLLEI
jgi:rubrerythrin